MSAVGVARGRRVRGGVQGGYVVWAGVAVGACGHSVDSMVGVFRRDFGIIRGDSLIFSGISAQMPYRSMFTVPSQI